MIWEGWFVNAQVPDEAQQTKHWLGDTEPVSIWESELSFRQHSRIKRVWHGEMNDKFMLFAFTIFQWQYVLNNSPYWCYKCLHVVPALCWTDMTLFEQLHSLIGKGKVPKIVKGCFSFALKLFGTWQILVSDFFYIFFSLPTWHLCEDLFYQMAEQVETKP